MSVCCEQNNATIRIVTGSLVLSAPAITNITLIIKIH